MNTISKLMWLVVLLTASQLCQAEKANFPVGSWELCHDPDGGEKDIMHFLTGGAMQVVRKTGQSTQMTYAFEGSTVMLHLMMNGKNIDIPLTVSADKKKLFNYSERTKASAYYVRLGNPDKFACTAQ